MIRFILTLVGILSICEDGGMLEAAPTADNIDWGQVRTLLSKINTAIRKQKEANEIENIGYSSLSDDKDPRKRQNPLTGDLFTEFGKRQSGVNVRQPAMESANKGDQEKRQNPLTGDLFTEFGKRNKPCGSNDNCKRQNPLTGDLFTEFGKRNKPCGTNENCKRQNPLTGDLFTEFGKRGHPMTGDIFTEFEKRQNPLTGDLFTEFGKRRGNESPYSLLRENDLPGDESIEESQRRNSPTGEIFAGKGQRNPLEEDVFKGDTDKRQNPLTGDLFTEFGKRQNTAIDGKISDEELADIYLQREENEQNDILR